MLLRLDAILSAKYFSPTPTVCLVDACFVRLLSVSGDRHDNSSRYRVRSCWLLYLQKMIRLLFLFTVYANVIRLREAIRQPSSLLLKINSKWPSVYPYYVTRYLCMYIICNNWFSKNYLGGKLGTGGRKPTLV